MAQPRSRLPLYAGLTVAGVTGYYLYSAGGSPKVAEKQFESMQYLRLMKLDELTRYDRRLAQGICKDKGSTTRHC